MQVQLFRRKEKLVVRLKGELDHHSAQIFRGAVEKELMGNKVQDLILNMKSVTFMDSSGIGAILGRYKQVRANDGKMVICSASPHIQKILQMGGIPKIIPLVGDEKNALEK
ncbi:MAG TPA: anti-sigma F factor antagonist [Firmicutes bacterium]|nr:anti-sigma F factor antagonist [Bacillota bacterium]